MLRFLILIVILASATSTAQNKVHPKSSFDVSRSTVTSAATALPIVAAAAATTALRPSLARADDAGLQAKTGTLPAEAYTSLNGQKMCRLLNGMWQVSGAHGYDPYKVQADIKQEMASCAEGGYTTFDLADIYGPAENFVGRFKTDASLESIDKQCQFFTKWVPRPQEVSKSLVDAAIDRSRQRMQTSVLDLVQFHWWDYNNKNYFDAMKYLTEAKGEGAVRSVGLTNFDTEHMVGLMDKGAPIVSNQVSYSILDTRPAQLMAPVAVERDVKLLCYGTLLGGFISPYWKGKRMPKSDELSNVSLRKYLPWIQYWGGWGLFQEMLTVLDTVAEKHSVSMANVALRWVLDQPAVGGAIVGVRLGMKGGKLHLDDNRRVFSFSLDAEDRGAIAAVQAKSKDLIKVFGDCGGEYRA